MSPPAPRRSAKSSSPRPTIRGRELLAEASRNRLLGVTLFFIRYLASLDGLAVGITEERAAELCWALTDGHRLLVSATGAPPTSTDGCSTASRRHCAYRTGPQPSDKGTPKETYHCASAA